MNTPNYIRIITFLLIGIISHTANAQLKEYPNDPMKLKETVLDNGMRILLIENHDKPEIYGAIAVNVGSKNDPKDNTGMAHYLEHMLFKGTTTMGTLDYQKEKIHLDKINTLYEELGKEKDEEQRLEIQKKINEQSKLATQYALPNEFDRIIAEMGGTELNAFTSTDMTVYLNKFPANQIEKWLDVYVHRFQEPVFRLFQSELETVYEEKNRSMNEPINHLIEEFIAEMFAGHPYGDQTTLGKTEHLKNPSLKTMYDYFYKFYVPNNMALILVGDFDSEKILPLIAKKMNEMPRKALEKQEDFSIEPIVGKKVVEMKSSPVKMAVYGFRTEGQVTLNAAKFDVLMGVLTNDGSTGLVDELTIDGEVLASQVFDFTMKEHGCIAILNVPKLVGQSFETAETLLFAKLDSLKAGNFDEKLVELVKKELLKFQKMEMEDNGDMGYELIEYFISGRDWSAFSEYATDLEKITKEDIIAYANAVFGADYLALYSKMGSTKMEKLKKPPFKPVPSKNTQKSSYYNSLANIKESISEFDYVNFETDVKRSKLDNGTELSIVKNPKNDIFGLKYRWEIGTYNEPKLKHLAEYLNLVGTKNKKFSDYRKELQDLNASFYFSVDKRYFYLEIDGEDGALEETITLISEMVKEAAQNEDKIKEIVQGVKAENKFEQSSPNSVARALREYTMYKEASSHLNNLTVKEVKEISAQDYLDLFTTVQKYPVSVEYVGNNDQIVSYMNGIFTTTASKKVEKSYIDLKMVHVTENTIYFINDKKATQSNIHFTIDVEKIPLEEQYKLAAFNEYFGGGMSSLVFQEIREFRSLAYSTYGTCRAGATPSAGGIFYGFIGCQNDKAYEAVSIMMNLIDSMPVKTERLEYIKGAVIRSSGASKPGFRSVNTQIEKWQEQGYNQDPNAMFREKYKDLSFDEIVEFYEKYIKGKPVSIAIVGDKSKLDLKALSEFGKVKVLKKKDIYVE